jgi:GDPmannose 4,6-dehydratase
MKSKNQKIALITGVTGQDGSYLAELLLDKGYKVYGLVRRNSSNNLGNSEHLREDLNVIWGDLTDHSSLVRAVKKAKPDEVYNLAAQSFVGRSWDIPVYTSDVNGIGTLKLLEAIREIDKDIKFYQASTSELFGDVKEMPQSESTPFNPRSPYGVSKLFAHEIVKNYRESFNMYACSGILFNHESPRRGEEFVTRKITSQVAEIRAGFRDYIEIGNMDAKRDWGYSYDYVKAMWLMLQQDKPKDYVIASGETHTVRHFLRVAFEKAGIGIEFDGEGVDEVGFRADTGDFGDVLVKVNPKFFRPTEVDVLLGDPSKAKEDLGWNTEYDFEDLVEEMVNYDLTKQGVLNI